MVGGAVRELLWPYGPLQSLRYLWIALHVVEVRSELRMEKAFVLAQCGVLGLATSATLLAFALAVGRLPPILVTFRLRRVVAPFLATATTVCATTVEGRETPRSTTTPTAFIGKKRLLPLAQSGGEFVWVVAPLVLFAAIVLRRSLPRENAPMECYLTPVVARRV